MLTFKGFLDVTDMDFRNYFFPVLVLFGIGLLLVSDLWLLSLQSRQTSDLEAVKSQFQPSQRSLVTFPATDWRFVVIFSLVGLSLGAGLGYWLAEKKR